MDFERAARFRDEKTAALPPEQKMPRAALEVKWDAFLGAHQTLATGRGDRLRSTPLEALPTPLYLPELRLTQAGLLFFEFQKAGHGCRRHWAVNA